jgi:hypothetical protein
VISVILPTLWKPDPLFIIETVTALSKHELVGEIIIIDNNPSKTPSHIFEIGDNVFVYPQHQNIFVNPAWNLGVEYSKFDNLLIINDDIQFNTSLLHLVYPHLSSNVGMIGVGESCWGDITSPFSLIPVSYRNTGYGCLFFIHKESYKHIPHEMKIWCGDDYLFIVNKMAGKTNLSINHHSIIRYNNQFSISSDDSTFDKIKVNDKQFYQHLLKTTLTK